jgi:hypothetical protein
MYTQSSKLIWLWVEVKLHHFSSSFHNFFLFRHMRLSVLFMVLLASAMLALCDTCATPTYSPDSGSFASPLTISVSCATTGAQIWYTDYPSGSSSPTLINSGQLILTACGNHYISLYATANGMNNSNYAMPYYTVTAVQVATPVIDPAMGGPASSLMITISCSTAQATIRYTLDGSTPSETHGII